MSHGLTGPWWWFGPRGKEEMNDHPSQTIEKGMADGATSSRGLHGSIISEQNLCARWMGATIESESILNYIGATLSP